MSSKFLNNSSVKMLFFSVSPVPNWELYSNDMTARTLNQEDAGILDDATEIECVVASIVRELELDYLLTGRNEFDPTNIQLPTPALEFIQFIVDHKVFQYFWDEEVVWIACK